MAQSTDGYSVADGPGATVRAAINANLQAAASSNGGTSAPATTFPHMAWADETADLDKIRNEANSAWITRGAIDETNGIYTPAVPLGQCRLSFASSTSIKLLPFQGNRVTFPSGAAAVIPSAGVSIGNGGLSAATLYYVYLYLSAGTPTLELSTTGHATDAASGIEIKSGDATRTLVGMIRTNGSSQFVDSATQRFVASWFNRQGRDLSGSQVLSATTTSTSYVELSSSARAEAVVWGDEAATIMFDGYGSNSTPSMQVQSGIALDGATGPGASLTASPPTVAVANANQSTNLSHSIPSRPAEGYHYWTPVAFVSGGTGTFTANVHGVIRS